MQIPYSSARKSSFFPWLGRKERAGEKRKKGTFRDKPDTWPFGKAGKSPLFPDSGNRGVCNSRKGKERHERVGEKASNLLQLFQEHNTEFEKRIGVNRVYDTYYSYLLTYKHLSNFIRMKYNSEDVPLISLTHKFINDFDFYLRVEKRMQASTVLGRWLHWRK